MERKGGYPSSASFDRQLRDKYEGASYARDRAEIKGCILGLFDDAFAGKLDGWKRGNILKDGRGALLLGGINRASTWAAKFSDKSFVANPRCSVKVAELTNSDRAQHDFWWAVRRRRWLGRSAHDVNRIVACAAGMVRPRGGLRSARPYSLRKALVELGDMLGPR